MTCKDFITFLMDYLSGELPEGQQALFEKHLEVCDSCVAYLSNYRDTIELSKASMRDLDGPVPEEVPQDLVAAVLSARRAGPR